MANTYASTTEICRNLQISVGHGSTLKKLFEEQNVPKRGATFERDKALAIGQEFVAKLRAASKRPGAVGVPHPNAKGHKKSTSSVKIMIALGDKETTVLTMTQAQDLYDSLRKIFGDKK